MKNMKNMKNIEPAYLFFHLYQFCFTARTMYSNYGCEFCRIDISDYLPDALISLRDIVISLLVFVLWFKSLSLRCIEGWQEFPKSQKCIALFPDFYSLVPKDSRNAKSLWTMIWQSVRRSIHFWLSGKFLSP